MVVVVVVMATMKLINLIFEIIVDGGGNGDDCGRRGVFKGYLKW